MIHSILFDVDFTLIFPGPTFRGEGYQAFCERYGMRVDVSRFDRAVASAGPLLDAPDDVYDAEVFVRYTRHIIEQMGGCGDHLDACAREIYDEWAACQHFELYDDVPAVLGDLVASGLRIGLISNSHRCLTSFQSHFELQGLVSAAISGPEHGFMKPNPSIFRAVLEKMHARPEEALMVGDSLRQDVEGALRTGMRAALLHRSDDPHPQEDQLVAAAIPVVRSLTELPKLLSNLQSG